MKRICGYLLGLFFFFSPWLVSAGQVELYFMASINGHLDGCECPDRPRAGLVTSAHVLDQRDSQNSLFFLGGDWMELYPDRELHESIVEVFRLLDPDLFGLGDQELTEGLPWLLSQDLPIQVNNLSVQQADSSGSASLGDSPALYEKQGISFAVLSLVDRDAFSQERQTDLLFEDPLAQARDFCDTHNQEADVLVLLFHGYEDKARTIAALCPELDIIYLSHEQQEINETLGSTLLLSPGQDGNNVSVLNIERRWGRIKMEHRLERLEYDVHPVFPPAREIVERYYNTMYGNLDQ